ncbi:hypothetical protein ACLB2K_068955 [Fragaria x ananassa]
MQPTELKRVFQMFDRNGDGRISKEELSHSLENLGIFIPDQELFNMINKIDVDGDGCVDIDEFGELYQSIMDEFGELYQSIMDERDCTRMITKVDVDGDGMVNYKNFKHAGKLMNEFHDLEVVSMGRAYAVWIGVLGFKSHCSQGYIGHLSNLTVFFNGQLTTRANQARIQNTDVRTVLRCGFPSVRCRRGHASIPAASPTTFPPWRVRRIPVFQPDHPKLQTKSIWQENWNSVDSPGRESGRGSCWSPLGWRRAIAGGERRDVHTLRAVRMSAPDNDYIYIYICIYREDEKRTSALGLKCGRPSLLHPPAPATARLHPRRLQQRPRPLSLPGESVFFQFSGEIDFWVISLENWKKTDSPGRESGRGRCWSLLGWRRAVAGAGGWRTDGDPHFKAGADVRSTSSLLSSVRNVSGKEAMQQQKEGRREEEDVQIIVENPSQPSTCQGNYANKSREEAARGRSYQGKVELQKVQILEEQPQEASRVDEDVQIPKGHPSQSSQHIQSTAYVGSQTEGGVLKITRGKDEEVQILEEQLLQSSQTVLAFLHAGTIEHASREEKSGWRLQQTSGEDEEVQIHEERPWQSSQHVQASLHVGSTEHAWREKKVGRRPQKTSGDDEEVQILEEQPCQSSKPVQATLHIGSIEHASREETSRQGPQETSEEDEEVQILEEQLWQSSQHVQASLHAGSIEHALSEKKVGRRPQNGSGDDEEVQILEEHHCQSSKPVQATLHIGSIEHASREETLRQRPQETSGEHEEVQILEELLWQSSQRVQASLHVGSIEHALSETKAGWRPQKTSGEDEEVQILEEHHCQSSKPVQTVLHIGSIEHTSREETSRQRPKETIWEGEEVQILEEQLLESSHVQASVHVDRIEHASREKKAGWRPQKTSGEDEEVQILEQPCKSSKPLQATIHIGSLGSAMRKEKLGGRQHEERGEQEVVRNLGDKPSAHC